VPELPEVETVVRSIAPLKGRRIVSAEIRCLRILRGGDPDLMAERLAGSRIAGVRRFGKFVLIDLRPSGHLLVHLGMTGRLLLGGAPGKHTHAIFTFDRGSLLYDDSRQFGRIEYFDDVPERLGRLGPEPLEIAFDDFHARFKGRRTSVKALLLNQDFVRGIGNIYADESLFRAGIHPKALAARLRKDRVRKLYDSVREVLAEAIEAGGSSISDYVDAEGRKGFFQISHRVYGREGEPCTFCQTPVRRDVVAQRGTHFCPRCQKR
jgi:formamidopyrimidine-DNA glycosylase